MNNKTIKKRVHLASVWGIDYRNWDAIMETSEEVITTRVGWFELGQKWYRCLDFTF
jgi:hypothetical protein